ncbi:MAG: hypothetical protein ACTS4Y_00915 [Candidatus Hodgkinia cicadicola]
MVSLFESNFGSWFNGGEVVSAAEVLKLLPFGGQLSPPMGVLARKPGGGEGLSLTSSAWCGGDLVKTCIIASEVNLPAGCNVCFRMRRLPRFLIGASESAISAGGNVFCVAKVDRMSLTNRGNVFRGTQKPAEWLSFKLEIWNQNPTVAFERLIAQTLGAL